MKLKKQVDNRLVINNLHKLFKDTPYEHEKFTITIRLDTTSEMSSLTDAIIDETVRTGDKPSNSIPYALITKWKLLSPIISWTGFYGEDDEESPCTHENKSAFYEMPDYVDLFSIIRDIKEDYIKSKSSKTQAIKEETKKS